jgi:enamine deaminase RidA (YjgF/YER057c/UK114 family)
VGAVAYVAIQFPVRDGQWSWRGRLGREISTEEGYQAARACALNVLSQLDLAPGLDRIAGLNRIEAYMLTTPGWEDWPRVLDGASHLFVEALGENGRHARTLFGVERLPRDVPIALTATATLHP